MRALDLSRLISAVHNIVIIFSNKALNNHIRLTPALGAKAEAVEAVRAKRRTFIVVFVSEEGLVAKDEFR